MSISEKQLNKSPYKEKIKYFVSNYDLISLFPNCKIVKFADLDNYKSIYELLPSKIDFVFILTETEPNHGHWQLLLRNNNEFEFFDSYGDSPKTILDFIPKYMNKLLGNSYNEDIGHILKSIKPSDKLTINKYPFQSEIEGVNTCGRWISSRVATLLYNQMNNKAYINYIESKRKESKIKTNDELITQLINI